MLASPEYPSVVLTLMALIIMAHLSLPGVARAQFDTATVLGTIKDSSGAVVPGATVTLKNTATATATPAPTDADGNYQFLTVRIGAYVVRAELRGFLRGEARDVAVTVGARRRASISR